VGQDPEEGIMSGAGEVSAGGVLDVPAQRHAPLRRLLDTLLGAQRLALTTHVNADGDGAGSQAALAEWLQRVGRQARVVNPTRMPAMFRFLFADDGTVADAGTSAGDQALRDADLLVVLDTAEAGRIGRVARAASTLAVAVIDHHVQVDGALTGTIVADATACATGELIYDLLLVAGLPRPWPQGIIEGIYTAIVTDTGSFRFANSTPRAHAIAGDLIAQGVDPELMYRRIFATVPMRRIELLRHALQNLEVDVEHAITWITIERGVMERLGATSEDLDGVVEHARSIEGTEVAILFRETADGSTKVSLRSAGDVDVNAIARQFGGGGHVKASGALLPERLDSARPRLIEATRQALEQAGVGFRGQGGPS
jgi:bifunctional oligoribonuclease and PAP phosphatase NrnA